jgi:hypothetical protein
MVQIDEGQIPATLDAARTHTNWPDTSACNGICFPRSQLNSAHVRDGMASTYLLGEKYINPLHYLSGECDGDNATAYSGYGNDVVRWGRDGIGDDPTDADPPLAWLPLLDRRDRPTPRAGEEYWHCFGSPHSPGCYFALCDGSVRLISFDIDPRTHELLCNRKDGQPLDSSKIE